MILQDFMDVEYIALETNNEFATAANTPTLTKDYILFTNRTRSNDEIFFFDLTGKGVRKIKRFGQGGEEYINIHNIILDEENSELYVNSTFVGKGIIYDLFGTYKRSFSRKVVYDYMGNFDSHNFICHDGDFQFENGTVIETKRNCFFLISKQDGTRSKEISIPYDEKIPMILMGTGSNGRLTDRAIRNRELIPYRNDWILIEPSADTIYSYSPEDNLKPFIVRTPSVQSMNPEIFLFPGVINDRYCFMQTVKKTYDFKSDEGFPKTDLVYDKQEKSIFECIVYNDDFTERKSMSLVYEIPMFTFVNNEVAFIKKLEAFELVEAYKKGELKGRLKEVAAGLNEESNPVIMLAKWKD